jgi:DNA-binding transcriptional LysR family regulator
MHALIDTPDLETATLAREKLVAALPANHAAARIERLDLGTLSEETFLVPKRHEFVGFHEVVVGEGLGVAFVPESFREKVRITGLVYRPLSSTLEIDLVAVWLNGNHSLPLEKLRTFFPDALGSYQSITEYD